VNVPGFGLLNLDCDSDPAQFARTSFTALAANDDTDLLARLGSGAGTRFATSGTDATSPTLTSTGPTPDTAIYQVVVTNTPPLGAPDADLLTLTVTAAVGYPTPTDNACRFHVEASVVR
jgi:hypothetical protein